MPGTREAGEGRTQSPDRIPVLTYHSHRIEGTAYATNDHVALSHDLRTIQAWQFTIIPLHQLAAWVVTPQAQELPARAIGLSCDDGADTDYYDCDHPVYGPQRSFYNILRDFQTEIGAAAQPLLHMTCFGIASYGLKTHSLSTYIILSEREATILLASLPSL